MRKRPRRGNPGVWGGLGPPPDQLLPLSHRNGSGGWGGEGVPGKPDRGEHRAPSRLPARGTENYSCERFIPVTSET